MNRCTEYLEYAQRGIEGFRELYYKNLVPTVEYPCGEEQEFFRGGNVLLRRNGDMIESSMGEKMPVERAKEYWNEIQRMKRSGHVCYLFCKIGGRQTACEFDGKVLYMNCHCIAFEEMKRMAKEIL